jgi:ubiquinone/menaquinone biosynthesis C-methylase UbiE
VKYNPAQVAAYYDSYGEQEWDRFSKNPAALVSLHIHQHYLKKYVKSNDLVLEVGAGAGRFTIELAKLGASITVGDISSEQLKLNQKYADKYQSEISVSSRLQLDITDLSMFEAASFDDDVLDDELDLRGDAVDLYVRSFYDYEAYQNCLYDYRQD